MLLLKGFFFLSLLKKVGILVLDNNGMSNPLAKLPYSKTPCGKKNC